MSGFLDIRAVARHYELEADSAKGRLLAAVVELYIVQGSAARKFPDQRFWDVVRTVDSVGDKVTATLGDRFVEDVARVLGVWRDDAEIEPGD